MLALGSLKPFVSVLWLFGFIAGFHHPALIRVFYRVEDSDEETFLDSTVDIFPVADVKEVNTLGVQEAELNPVVAVNPKTPHLFVVRFELLSAQ